MKGVFLDNAEVFELFCQKFLPRLYKFNLLSIVTSSSFLRLVILVTSPIYTDFYLAI